MRDRKIKSKKQCITISIGKNERALPSNISFLMNLTNKISGRLVVFGSRENMSERGENW